MEIKNPDKSEKRWAASERIAREEAKIPPRTSAIIKIVQTMETVNNLHKTLLEMFYTSGKS
jgi:hypothetical protein